MKHTVCAKKSVVATIFLKSRFFKAFLNRVSTAEFHQFQYLSSSADSFFQIRKSFCVKGKMKKKCGLSRDLNPGPLAPKARIIPLDH